MTRERTTVTVTIDNRTLPVAPGSTILQAATQHGIYIPTLCAHKDLAPFGGCRLCIVEVEGMRGFPTACTTPVEDGMIVRTHTAQVHAIRSEVLQLILSEHTSSCLICDEKDECRSYSTTIRKVGVTTGCRWCPNDGDCELQRVVDHLGLTAINYPVYYRGLPVEKDDPFYDRDYNLCILCGRCVRMCQDERTAATLAFCRRGGRTVIGPAFGRTHMDAGCEFCGACVDVCPTGALAEKVSKWDGKPDREQPSTCPLCGLGCRIRLLIKGDRVIGSRPEADPSVNGSQLCVKGRFCVTETVGAHDRLARPYVIRNGYQTPVSPDEAVAIAAERLAGCPPDRFGMLVSPDCTNEDLYIAQKFARVVMRSHHIDTSARLFFGPAFNAWLRLLPAAVPFSRLHEADAILCIGLDARFGRSVVGAALRAASHRGAKIITIHPHEHSFSVLADHWIQPTPGTETEVLRSLITSASDGSGSGSDEGLRAAAGILRSSKTAVILVGSEYLHGVGAPEILDRIVQLAHAAGAGVLPLPAQGNLFGSLIMGACPELLPGLLPVDDHAAVAGLARMWDRDITTCSASWDATALPRKDRLDVLYLVGETLPDTHGAADFVIYQNTYPPDPPTGVDLVLPAAAFTEVDGTLVNGEGRIRRLSRAVDPPGDALPDWAILARVARAMGAPGFDHKTAADVEFEIGRAVAGFTDADDLRQGTFRIDRDVRLDMLPASAPHPEQTGEGPAYILRVSLSEHTHRGFPLCERVEGARRIFPVSVLLMHPDDAMAAGLGENDHGAVTGPGLSRIWPVRLDRDQRPGVVTVVLPPGDTIPPNPQPVRIEKRHV